MAARAPLPDTAAVDAAVVAMTLAYRKEALESFVDSTLVAASETRALIGDLVPDSWVLDLVDQHAKQRVDFYTGVLRLQEVGLDAPMSKVAAALMPITPMRSAAKKRRGAGLGRPQGGFMERLRLLPLGQRLFRKGYRAGNGGVPKRQGYRLRSKYEASDAGRWYWWEVAL